MSRFLFTMLWSNDLGIPTRSIPIALELKQRGHEVFFCCLAEAPHKLIKDAGLRNLIPDLSRFEGHEPDPEDQVAGTPEVWDFDHFACLVGFGQERSLRNSIDAHLELIDEHEIDVVVDSENPTACVAARVRNKRLVTIIQSDLHPASSGFIWWKEKPAGVPSAAAKFNAVLPDYGRETIATTSELLLGDLTLCAGTPETDPLPSGVNAVYMGPLFSPKLEAELPDWVDAFAMSKPLIWVYCGNPKYHGASGWANSIVVLKAAWEGLADRDEVRVLTTTGYQNWPEELPALPDNFRNDTFLPGLSLARRSSLLIHHGGHNSGLIGALAGTPALIIPTFTERESNARRMANLGVAEILFPDVDEAGEKHVSGPDLRSKVESILADETMSRKAAALSENMRNFGGVGQVADHIENLV